MPRAPVVSQLLPTQLLPVSCCQSLGEEADSTRADEQSDDDQDDAHQHLATDQGHDAPDHQDHCEDPQKKNHCDAAPCECDLSDPSPVMRREVPAALPPINQREWARHSPRWGETGDGLHPWGWRHVTESYIASEP